MTMRILFGLSLGSGCIIFPRLCLVGSCISALIFSFSLCLFCHLRGYDWSLIKGVSVALAAMDNMIKGVFGYR